MEMLYWYTVNLQWQKQTNKNKTKLFSKSAGYHAKQNLLRSACLAFTLLPFRSFQNTKTPYDSCSDFNPPFPLPLHRPPPIPHSHPLSAFQFVSVHLRLTYLPLHIRSAPQCKICFGSVRVCLEFWKAATEVLKYLTTLKCVRIR